MDRATRLEIFRAALRTRRLEERIISLARTGEVPAALHAGAGHEVCQAAVLAAFAPDDPMLYGHRGTGYWVARGLPFATILCDAAYREGGTNRGKGGLMHVVDPARGILGESGTLGGNFVIGAGIAFAEQYRRSGRVTIVFFGDGTASRGQFHEAANFASLRRLPIVFFCENNGWGLSVPTYASSAVQNIADRAAGYAMPGVVVDGRDAGAVYDAALAAAERARSGSGPSLVEMKVDRLHAHYLGDRDAYRRDVDRAAAWARDPVPRLRDELLDAGALDTGALATLEHEIAAELDAAVDHMRAQPLVAASTARESVFSSGA
jgi:pyruvate dehydrogenase E1 component alpha subunit